MPWTCGLDVFVQGFSVHNRMLAAPFASTQQILSYSNMDYSFTVSEKNGHYQNKRKSSPMAHSWTWTQEVDCDMPTLVGQPSPKQGISLPVKMKGTPLRRCLLFLVIKTFLSEPQYLGEESEIKSGT